MTSIKKWNFLRPQPVNSRPPPFYPYNPTKLDVITEFPQRYFQENLKIHQLCEKVVSMRIISL